MVPITTWIAHIIYIAGQWDRIGQGAYNEYKSKPRIYSGPEVALWKPVLSH